MRRVKLDSYLYRNWIFVIESHQTHTHPRLITGLVTHHHWPSHDHREQHLVEFILVLFCSHNVKWQMTTLLWSALLNKSVQGLVFPSRFLQPVHCCRRTTLMGDRPHITESTLSDKGKDLGVLMSKKTFTETVKTNCQTQTHIDQNNCCTSFPCKGNRNPTCPCILLVKLLRSLSSFGDYSKK